MLLDRDRIVGAAFDSTVVRYNHTHHTFNRANSGKYSGSWDIFARIYVVCGQGREFEKGCTRIY